MPPTPTNRMVAVASRGDGLRSPRLTSPVETRRSSPEVKYQQYYSQPIRRIVQMEHSRLSSSIPIELTETSGKNEAHSSGVSWAAVIGGAFVAAALSLILLTLGTGLGLSSVSPWSGVGASASTVGMVAIFWLILMQIISSSMGGYLAGRLRTKWAHIHTDEVYFRDTAHGFLAWAVALVITAGFLASAAPAMVGAAAASPAGGTGGGGGGRA